MEKHGIDLSQTTDKTVLVDGHGRPARQAIDTRCPRCRVECPRGDTAKRVRSGGFGLVHDCCVNCGFEFEESTV